ncbi:hypothetical protein [Paenibacillus phytohabitans]|uniref:hypothetical protein n=1 Tax=Paenibacillus phytohabitans TaxID=2654978 RepID=UPI00300B8539
MIEEIIELPIVKTLGWGGMISLLGIVIPFIWRLNPITTLTSTKFERILFSKEKRLSVKFFWNVGTIFLSIFFFVILFSFYFALFSTKHFTNNKSEIDLTILVISILFFCSISILYIVSNFNFSLKVSKYGITYWIFNSRNKKLTWILSIYFLYLVSSFSLLPSAFADLVNERKKLTSDDLFLGIALLLINNLVLVIISKMIFRALIKKFARYIGETFYYDGDDGQRWYIYHLADKSTYLLGDAVDPNDSEVFTTIEKSELLSKKINVYRIPNELDRTQEP